MKSEIIQPSSLVIDTGLLDYLAPDTAKAYTRLGAFHSLLTHACSFTSSTCRFGQQFDLTPGQFVVTISDLAKEWHWSRGAVRRFIDNLCQLGQLEVTSYVKCAVVDVVSLRFKWSDGHHPFAAFNCYTDFANRLALADQSPETKVFCPSMPDLSGIDIDTPYVDVTGKELYSLAQRRHAAFATQDLLVALTKASLASVYSPKVEKSVLDVYHEVCDGDREKFNALVADLFKSPGDPFFDEAQEIFGGWIDRTEQFLSLASSRLLGTPSDQVVGNVSKKPKNASKIASDEVDGEL